MSPRLRPPPPGLLKQHLRPSLTTVSQGTSSHTYTPAFSSCRSMYYHVTQTFCVHPQYISSPPLSTQHDLSRLARITPRMYTRCPVTSMSRGKPSVLPLWPLLCALGTPFCLRAPPPTSQHSTLTPQPPWLGFFPCTSLDTAAPPWGLPASQTGSEPGGSLPPPLVSALEPRGGGWGCGSSLPVPALHSGTSLTCPRAREKLCSLALSLVPVPRPSLG